VIERNIIVDCDARYFTGKNPQRSEPDQVHCSRFLVRNNFLTRVPENGIFAVHTATCQIIHNTIHDRRPIADRLVPGVV
jgi:hypothetical protein